ncbi:MAG: molybdenum cofactor biosynthesis protein MoaE [Magnetococcales bacterium]|nr:molybdenum cofactor biosynthesis protein MoaE [Magnetococcales bacterium]
MATIRVQQQDFSLEQEMHRLCQPYQTIGGIVSFVGTVREITGDERVTAIELEHYPGMTEAELQQIVTEAHNRFDLEAMTVIHRIGRLEAGEQIVLVLVAAAHRAAAFDACRYTIDQLKSRVTLWKKELSASGEHWVDHCPGCHAAVTVTGHSGWAHLRVGVVTLSDSRTLDNDHSGEALVQMVEANAATVVCRRLLPDDRTIIGQTLVELADQLHLDLILTNGGTGPGPRDVTPEATRDVCDREMPGLAELIRQQGLAQVRSAVLTRGIVALRHRTLVVNLPGSTRGVTHSLQAIADLIPHVLSMARGEGHENKIG